MTETDELSSFRLTIYYNNFRGKYGPLHFYKHKTLSCVAKKFLVNYNFAYNFPYGEAKIAERIPHRESDAQSCNQ